MFNFTDVNDYLEWRFWVGLWTGVLLVPFYGGYLWMKHKAEQPQKKREWYDI